MAELRTLGMFPLSTVLFPCAGLPLHVFEARYRALIADCLASDREFGVVLIARGSEVGEVISGSTWARWPGSTRWRSWRTDGCW